MYEDEADDEEMTQEEAEEMVRRMEDGLPPDILAAIDPEKLRWAREMMVKKILGHGTGDVLDEIGDIVDSVHVDEEGRQTLGFVYLKISRTAAAQVHRILKIGQRVVRNQQLDFVLMARLDALYHRVMRYKDYEALEKLPMLVAEHEGVVLPRDPRTGNLDRQAMNLNDDGVMRLLDYSRRACKAMGFVNNAETSVLPHQLRQLLTVKEAEHGFLGGAKLPRSLVDNVDGIVDAALASDNAERSMFDPDFTPFITFNDPDFDESVDLTEILGPDFRE